MCPSYMATREEKHSTRGRANTLRLAMAGRLGEAGLGDHDVHDVLDLCLECRACKAECPVGVDVARFKSEFLAGYWQRHGMPLRRASSATCARAREMRQPLRAAVELVAGSGVGTLDQRAAARHRSTADAAGLRAHDVQRALRSVAGRAHARRPQLRSPQHRTVVLFDDTFTNYNHPEIGIAAADVLDAAGVGVRVAAARLLRPSADLAGPARRSARRGAGQRRRALRRRRHAASGFCFSSRAACRRCARTRRRCCAARRSAGRAVVGDACMLFEDYVEQEWQAGRIAARSEAGPVDACCCTATVIRRRWGCCRRRARCWRASPACTVVDLDAGCCGMAGSFGYAKEHYEVSRADRRAEAAAGRARAGAWRRAGGAGHVVPRTGEALHRRRSAAPRAAAASLL